MSSKPIWEKFLEVVERSPKSTAIIEGKTGKMIEFYELERQATRWKDFFEILNPHGFSCFSSIAKPYEAIFVLQGG